MGLKRSSMPGARRATRAQKPHRSLQWVTAIVLLAVPAALFLYGGQLLGLGGGLGGGIGSVDDPAAGAADAAQQAVVEARAEREEAAGLKVPDYIPKEPMAPTPGQTVVTITFDDGFRGQAEAAEILTGADLAGTFYVNSGVLDSTGYLTLRQTKEMAIDGHEIGGHTFSHQDLTDLGTDEAARQICQDRQNLAGWGFAATSFAYPFASSTPEVENLVRDCGYNSARGLGGVDGPACEGCVPDEALQPENPYLLKAPEQVEHDWTLADLQDKVEAAGPDGGWVLLTFHGFCPYECTQIDVDLELFEEFVDWLADRTTDQSTVVRTVQQVIGGPNRGTNPGPVVEPVEPGENGITNPGLEERDKGGGPVCWMQGGFGHNHAEFGHADGRTGEHGSWLQVSDYTDGDAKLVPKLDLGACAPAVTPGHRYSLQTWYQADADTQFSVYYRDSAGSWHWWTASPYFETAAEFTLAEWTTPPVPQDATALSFGLALVDDGELVTDDYGLYDASVAPAPARSP